MVDLDGAKDGIRQNSDIVRAVAETGLRLELGGGIRSMADLEAVFALGVWRAVIGSAAVSNPDFVREAIAATAPTASLWVSTPRTVWYAPLAGRKTPGLIICPLPSKWN